jgi:DNA-binding NtrC family response regulator
VLVVDDDEALCDSLWDLLHERKLRVAIAHTEKEALKSLNDHRCQVVLVDLKLPGGDGRNLLKLLHERRPEIRTVMITGHPEAFDDPASSIRSLGADAVCYKPFDIGTLLSTVEQLAGRNRTGG